MEKVCCCSDIIKELSQEEALHKFIQERVVLIRENRYPLQLSSETLCRYIMHIVPVNYLALTLDIKQLARPDNYFFTQESADKDHIIHDFNFDGIIFYTSLHDKHGYTQVFRNGIIEIVVAGGAYIRQTGNTLSLLHIQENTLYRLAHCISVLKNHKIGDTYRLYFRMVGMDGIKLSREDIAQSGYALKGHTNPLVREELIFPTYTITKDEENIKSVIKPLFDIFWNTFGYIGAPD